MHRSESTKYISNNSFQRALANGEISSLGYGFVTVPALARLTLKTDEITEKINALLNSLALPPKRVVFSSRSLNPFINHLITTPTYIVEVEKDCMEIVFDMLRNEFPGKTLWAPNEEERLRYGWPGTIWLYPLLTKSPTLNDGSIAIEKLIVDLICNPHYSRLFSGTDIEQALFFLSKRYEINFRTLFAYAKRKGKQKVVYDQLSECLGDSYQEIMHVAQTKL